MRESLAIAVPSREAERVRGELLKLGILRRDLRPRREDDRVLFPVSKPVEGYENIIAEFPEVKRIPAFRIPFDVVGDIAIIRHPDAPIGILEEEAERIIEYVKNVRLVLLDEGVYGETRRHRLRILAGSGPMATVHRENGIRLYVELDKVYFSPRLSYERGRVASQVRAGERVFDMFAGVGPFSILLAKRGAGIVHSCDINPDASRLALKNAKLNKVEDRVRILSMDAASAVELVGKVDRVIMNLPLSAVNFLPLVLDVVRSGGKIHLYYLGGKEEIPRIPGGLEVESSRIVHSFSPGRYVKVLDLVRRSG